MEGIVPAEAILRSLFSGRRSRKPDRGCPAGLPLAFGARPGQWFGKNFGKNMGRIGTNEGRALAI
jgi:hypothetical protein